MSSRTSSRSTLTMVPSTMSPSLKYLIVLSIAARKSSSDPMSLMATCGAPMGAVGAVAVSVVIRRVAPVDGNRGLAVVGAMGAYDDPASKRPPVNDRGIDPAYGARPESQPEAERKAARTHCANTYPTRQPL